MSCHYYSLLRFCFKTHYVSLIKGLIFVQLVSRSLFESLTNAVCIHTSAGRMNTTENNSYLPSVQPVRNLELWALFNSEPSLLSLCARCLKVALCLLSWRVNFNLNLIVHFSWWIKSFCHFSGSSGGKQCSKKLSLQVPYNKLLNRCKPDVKGIEALERGQCGQFYLKFPRD